MKAAKIFFRLLFIFILLVLAFRLGAAEPSPVGLWKTIDDSSGQPQGTGKDQRSEWPI